MKRILFLLLALAMIFSLFACGKPADNNASTDTTEAGEAREPLEPLLEKRHVPELKSREEMLDILLTEMYGKIPDAPTEVTYTVQEDTIENYAAGKARIHKVTVSGKLNGNPFSFPFITALPKTEEKVPFFVHIGFSSSNTSRFQPTEELIDHGYAVLFFHYEDVASDNSKLDNGIATALFPDGKRHNDDDPGKIAMWAWAASRVMDYAEAKLADKLDFTRSIVCGHSRLGKTALVAGATDTRFSIPTPTIPAAPALPSPATRAAKISTASSTPTVTGTPPASASMTTTNSKCPSISTICWPASHPERCW